MGVQTNLLTEATKSLTVNGIITGAESISKIAGAVLATSIVGPAQTLQLVSNALGSTSILDKVAPSLNPLLGSVQQLIGAGNYVGGLIDKIPGALNTLTNLPATLSSATQLLNSNLSAVTNIVGDTPLSAINPEAALKLTTQLASGNQDLISAATSAFGANSISALTAAANAISSTPKAAITSTGQDPTSISVAETVSTLLGDPKIPSIFPNPTATSVNTTDQLTTLVNQLNTSQTTASSLRSQLDSIINKVGPNAPEIIALSQQYKVAVQQIETAQNQINKINI